MKKIVRLIILSTLLSTAFVLIPIDKILAENAGESCTQADVRKGIVGNPPVRCTCVITGYTNTSVNPIVACTYKTNEQFTQSVNEGMGQIAKATEEAVGGVTGFTLGVLQDLVYWFGALMLSLAGAILSLAGVLLNYAIKLSVTNMSQLLATIGGVDAAWTAMRDLANIVFIFLLIYTAVRTILGLVGSHLRELIAKIIFVALIINFSLFFSKVVIDASNIVSLQFYNAIVGQSGDINNGISYMITRPLRLATIYANNGASQEIISQFGGADGDPTKMNLLVGSLDSKGTGLIAVYMSTIIVLIAALIFFYAAALFISRFAILVFLMATSPFALISFILPKADAKWWFDNFIKQTLLAPVFFVLMWIAFRIINTPAFISMSWLSEVSGQATGNTLRDAFTLGIPANMAVLLNFGIVIAFLVFALKSAQRVGGYGASLITNAAGSALFGATAFAARKTIGRGAAALTGNNRVGKAFQSAAASTGMRGLIANAALMGTRGVAKSSLDVRGTGVAKKLGVDLGKAGGKGGFIGQKAETAKAEAKYVKEAFSTAELAEKYAASEKVSIFRRMAGTNTAIAESVEKEAAKKGVAELKKSIPKAEDDLKKAQKELDDYNTLTNNGAFTPPAGQEKNVAELTEKLRVAKQKREELKAAEEKYRKKYSKEEENKDSLKAFVKEEVDHNKDHGADAAHPAAPAAAPAGGGPAAPAAGGGDHH